MKVNLLFSSKLASLFFVITAFAVIRLPIVAQENAEAEQDKLLPPAEETFADIDAVASPWIVGECPDASYKISNCHEVSYGKLRTLSRTSLYNEDGSLWYIYSNHHNDSDFYKKIKTMSFLPFAGYGGHGRNALLRMVGESKHWYKVEVNEKTQATKFILKSDPSWEKTGWDFWLAKIGQFTIDENYKTAIYDKPNGNIVGQADTGMRYFRYFGELSKRDDDWVYVQVSKDGYACYPVESKSEKCYPGWIRWRAGRKFLVKPDNILFTVTETKNDTKD